MNVDRIRRGRGRQSHLDVREDQSDVREASVRLEGGHLLVVRDAVIVGDSERLDPGV